MRLLDYLKDKLIFLFFQALIAAFVGAVMSVHQINAHLIALVEASIALATFSGVSFEYLKKRSYFKKLSKTMDALDKKLYLSELTEEGDFAEGRVMAEVIRRSAKAMNDEVAALERAQKEYREFVEAWVHEVKLPIASIGLLCENNKNEATESIAEETAKIAAFTEQALYYARLTDVGKDLVLARVNLKEAAAAAVKKHSAQLIALKCAVTVDMDDTAVLTDRKWLDFILGQIISNSIKYRNENFALRFSLVKTPLSIDFAVSDNGIGIPEKDLPRVFEKGFTGENGHTHAKSTGIGLYLCFRLCESLGVGISAKSDSGTAITLSFPRMKE